MERFWWCKKVWCSLKSSLTYSEEWQRSSLRKSTKNNRRRSTQTLERTELWDIRGEVDIFRICRKFRVTGRIYVEDLFLSLEGFNRPSRGTLMSLIDRYLHVFFWCTTDPLLVHFPNLNCHRSRMCPSPYQGQGCRSDLLECQVLRKPSHVLFQNRIITPY